MITWSQKAFPLGCTCFAGLSLFLGAWGAPKGEWQWDQACFWSSHAWVSICMWLPSIKQPSVIYWLGGKLVKYLLNYLPGEIRSLHYEHLMVTESLQLVAVHSLQNGNKQHFSPPFFFPSFYNWNFENNFPYAIHISMEISC